VPEPPPHWRESVAELQGYLSDQLPPLLVAGTIEDLLRESHSLVAEALHHWALSQAQVYTDLDLADLLYHCVRKLAMLGTLQLVDERELQDHLVGLSGKLMERCSGHDRARLEELLPRLHQELQHFFAPAPGLRHRVPGGIPGGGGGSGAPLGAPVAAAPLPTTRQVAVDPELTRATRRLSVLLSNLRSEPSPQHTEPRPGQDQVLTHLISTIAETARDSRELDRYVRELTRVGVEDSSLRGLLRALSTGLPEWAVADQGKGPPSKRADAIQRLLMLKGASSEPSEWLPEVLRLAVDHFNSGELGKAITMLEVATRSAEERRVDRQLVDRLLHGSWSAVDRDRLRDVSIHAESQAVLRRFLAFFPDAAPEGLLEALETAENQEQRQLCLAMLRVHGRSGREAALGLLRQVVENGVREDNRETARNALYLLRTVPDEITDDESHVVMLLCTAQTPAPVLREAVEHLAGWRVPSAESVLVGLMQELDYELAHPERSKRTVDEVHLLLNTVTKALLRLETSSARKVVVETCLGQTTYRREGLARLADLGLHDLSGEPALVERLVHELKRELPPRMLRRFFRRDEESISSLVMALAGTKSAQIAALLEDVVAAFPGRPISVAARESLERLRSHAPSEPSRPAEAAPAAPAPSIAGDLELFGLPTLLQNIEQNEMTGQLVLRNSVGAERVVMRFERGRLAACRNQGLEGEVAFFQLFENPFPGSFEFARREPAGGGQVAGVAVLPLLFEGMRRYDELQAARAVVPISTRLRLTDIAPTAGPTEVDGAFVRSVWNQVKAGVAVSEIARAVGCDDYRAITLIAHWVEEGALQAEPDEGA
jgi:hypothetical protein